jgi:hypothetical protein
MAGARRILPIAGAIAKELIPRQNVVPEIRPVQDIGEFGQNLTDECFGSPGTADFLGKTYADQPGGVKREATIAYNKIMALPEEHPWRIAEEPKLRILLGL